MSQNNSYAVLQERKNKKNTLSVTYLLSAPDVAPSRHLPGLGAGHSRWLYFRCLVEIFGTMCRSLCRISPTSLLSFPPWSLEPHKATACVLVISALPLSRGYPGPLPSREKLPLNWKTVAAMRDAEWPWF